MASRFVVRMIRSFVISGHSLRSNMKNLKRDLIAISLVVAVGFLLSYWGATSISAQPAGMQADVGAVLGPSIATHVITLKVQDQRGEPRIVTGKTTFDRPVQAYWVSLVGYDIKFEGNTEK